ncbi:hypothetical protein B5S33_g644 [[Candida] boidinii]|nr:hypothetical protein B5S30_g37 [[Candida] boidinii]OWB82023.1 hypothetical protein B5S33_g644 [[Candida] boidinii]GMG18068.1 unnamed protein product [[Candida] boidinii]
MADELKTNASDLKRKHPLADDETSNKRQKTQNNRATAEEDNEDSDEEGDTSSSGEEEESGEDSGSDSSDSSDESDREEIADDEEIDENKQFEVQESYHKLDEELIKQRTKIIREDGVALVSSSLYQIDDLFKNGKSLKFKKSNVFAKDSAILKEIGSQAVIATRNLKIGISDKILNFEVFQNKFIENFGTLGDDTNVAIEEDDSDIINDDSQYTRGRSRSRLSATSRTRNDSDDYNWIRAGLMYQSASNRAVTFDVLLGPLEIEQKQRVLKQRVRDDSSNGNAVTAAKKDATDIVNRDKDQDTTAASERVFRMLQKKEGSGRVNLFKFFINPSSFSKSVENLFFTSFLVNHNKLILGEDEEGIPYIQQANVQTLKNNERFKTRDDSKSHIIFNLDYHTWQALIKEYAVTDSFLE